MISRHLLDGDASKPCKALFGLSFRRPAHVRCCVLDTTNTYVADDRLEYLKRKPFEHLDTGDLLETNSELLSKVDRHTGSIRE